LTLPNTQTPPILTAIYEQIVNKTGRYNQINWRRNPPSEPKQDQTPTFTGVDTTDLGLQYRERELINSLTQHKLELEQEIQHRLRTQQIYSAYADSQKTLRQQLEVSRTREGKLKADLIAAERERNTLKDLIATLEASDVVLRADLATSVEEIREAEIMFDQQSKNAAEKDHAIRSTKRDLFAVRAELQDAEGKVARLDAELDSERKLLIHRTKELDEHAKTRRHHEAEMHRIAMKTEGVQKQLDILNALLLRFRALTQSLLDDSHTPHLTNYAITIAPDDTGQPPPPLKPPIPDVRTPHLDTISRPRPFSPKSLLQTPERNPHDPTGRHPPVHPHQIFAWLGRVSDWADSWRAGVESLLEVLSYLDAERAREAASRERSERSLQEKLAATKDELGVTQGELSSTMEELGVTQEELASTMEELSVTHEELAATKERLRVTQEEVSNAHHELNRERETLKGARAHAEDVALKFEACKVKLKDVQDARRVTIDKFCNAVDLLRQRNADLESLRAEAEASKSEAVTLSAVLRKRVEILEAEVNSLSLDKNIEDSCEESQLAQVNSPLFCPVDKGLCAFRYSSRLIC
jgi:chromosome segregation ATPase